MCSPFRTNVHTSSLAVESIYGSHGNIYNIVQIIKSSYYKYQSEAL